MQYSYKSMTSSCFHFKEQHKGYKSNLGDFSKPNISMQDDNQLTPTSPPRNKTICWCIKAIWKHRHIDTKSARWFGDRLEVLARGKYFYIFLLFDQLNVNILSYSLLAASFVIYATYCMPSGSKVTLVAYSRAPFSPPSRFWCNFLFPFSQPRKRIEVQQSHI